MRRRAMNQTESKMQLVINAFRDVIDQYTELPSPVNVTYCYDDDRLEFATDLYNDYVDLLRFYWGSYEAHINDWGVKCLFNDSLRDEILKFIE